MYEGQLYWEVTTDPDLIVATMAPYKHPLSMVASLLDEDVKELDEGIRGNLKEAMARIEQFIS